MWRLEWILGGTYVQTHMHAHCDRNFFMANLHSHISSSGMLTHVYESFSYVHVQTRIR